MGSTPVPLEISLDDAGAASFVASVTATGIAKPGTTSAHRYASVEPVTLYSSTGMLVVPRYWANTADRSTPVSRLTYACTSAPVTTRWRNVSLRPRSTRRHRASSSTIWRIVCSMLPPL